MVCVGGGWGLRKLVGVFAWCVSGLAPRGGVGGDGVGVALLVAGWAGPGAVLDGGLSLLPGAVGVAPARRAFWPSLACGGVEVRVGGACLGIRDGRLLAWVAGGGAAGGDGLLLVGLGAVSAHAWPPAGLWGHMVVRMSRACAVWALGGTGPCGGDAEGVLAVCGTTALVGTVVRVGAGGRCGRGTRDGAVRCGAPRTVGGLWVPAALGRGGDGAGGGCCSIGASEVRGRGGAGACRWCWWCHAPWPCVNCCPCMAWMCAGSGPWPGCRVRVLRYGGGGGR